MNLSYILDPSIFYGQTHDELTLHYDVSECSVSPFPIIILK